MKQRNLLSTILMAVMLMVVIGCGQANKVEVADYDAVRSQLEAKESEVKQLQTDVANSNQEVVTLKEELNQKDATLKDLEQKVSNTGSSKTTMVSAMPMLPSNASSGECYARLYYPSVYQSVVDTVLKSEASERVEILPAKYEWVDETILVKEESQKLKEIPAKYKMVEEKVLVQEAHTEWKKGRGLVEKVNESTGEIMCLVEIPAKYRTVTKQVIAEPAKVETIKVPAEYETVRVKKLTTSAQEKRIAIPAEYQTISRTVKVKDSRMEWKQVMCETNMSRTTVTKIQQALMDKGHNPGPIDGVIGPLTHDAIKSYQEANNLATGGLTYETLKSLKVQL